MRHLAKCCTIFTGAVFWSTFFYPELNPAQMIRTVIPTLILSGLTLILPAQVPALHIFPNPTEQAQHPNIEITYYIFPWSPSCHVLDSVVGGDIVSQGFYDGKFTVTIIWQEPVDSMPGQIAVVRTDSSCTYVAPGQRWEVPILPVSTIMPTIYGPTEYYIGDFSIFMFDAEMVFPTGGSALSFEWEAPIEWAVGVYGTRNAKAYLIIPARSTLMQGCVRVRGKYLSNTWSNWTNYCLQGVIHSPCPIVFADPTFVCGDTTSHLAYVPGVAFTALPPGWSPPEYVWTAPPGWTVRTDIPATQTSTHIQPDGHTNGSVSLVATAGGFTAPVCHYPVNFLPADPATKVTGPDYVCQTGKFQLSIPPPVHSEISWQVTPLDAATPLALSPDHGSGEASLEVLDPRVSGFFRITYTVAGVCGTTRFSKDFFVGQPLFVRAMLDGAPYSPQPVCAGSHGVSVEVQGSNGQRISWASSPGLQGYAQRDSFVFSLAAPEKAEHCPVLTASAANICGIATLPLEICPRTGCNLPQLDLLVYPNPAYIIVALETTATDPVTENYALIDKVEIFNSLGQLVTTWQEPPHYRIVKSVVDLPNGMYTLRATVWGQALIKQLIVTRQF